MNAEESPDEGGNFTGRSIPNLRHLRIIESVARNSSISLAAQEVNLSQPAVTQAIAKMERMVGRPLFERRHNGTFPSPAGDIFLARVRRFLSQCEEAFARGTQAGQASLRNITSTQLRSLLAIARSPTFPLAAQSIGISPATLNRASRDLEVNLGISIYKQTKLGMSLNVDGIELARRIALAQVEIEAAVDELQHLDGMETGRILIGTLPMSGAHVIGETIAELSERFADAHVAMTNAPYSMLVNSLQSGGIDMIFGLLRGLDDSSGFREEVLFSDPFCIIARPGHPLAGHHDVQISDLLPYDWIVPAENSPRRMRFEELFAGASERPRVSIEMSNMPAILAIISRRDHLLLANRREVERERQIGTISVLDWTSTLPPMIKGVTTRSNWLATPLQKRFLELLRAHAHALANRWVQSGTEDAQLARRHLVHETELI